MSDDGSRIDRLEARVAQLEAELERIRAGAADAVTEPGAPAPGPARPAPWERRSQLPPPPRSPLDSWTVEPAEPAEPAEAAEPREWPVVESETALKWGGVALVVLAVAFVVTTAIRRGWIGPELQLTGAVAVSLALIGIGLRLRPTRPLWSHPLCSGGVAALYTTVASNLFLDRVDDDVAFACTAVIGLGGYGLARMVPSEWVAGVSLTGGAVAWLVIADGEPPFTTSWLWMVLAAGAALALAIEQRWFGLRLLAHAGALLAILGLATEVTTGAQEALVYVATIALFGSLLWLPSKGWLSTAWEELEIQLVMVAAPWAHAVVATAAGLESDRELGAIALVIAGATAGLAAFLGERIVRTHLVSVVIGASVTLSIGLAFLLSTGAAFVALAVQCAGLVILSRALGHQVRILLNAGLVAVITAAYVTGNMVEAWTTDAAVGDDLAHLAIIGALAVAGWQSRDDRTRQATAIAVLVWVLLWLGSVLVHLPQGQAVVSVSWAVVGTMLLITGALRKVPEVGGAGLVVLAATVAKLLTVDLREVDTLWRAGLFFLIGTGIMRLGFLLPRLTGGEAEPEPEAEPAGHA